MNRPLKLSLAVALALGTSQAFALGLGPIVVKSKLNEPLVAEIVVNEGAGDEAATVNAQLASADDMKKVGVDTSQLGVPLDFNVVESGGRKIIRVTSRDAVRDPLLSFLVEVNWSRGRMLREYNVLLDPPIVAPAIVGTRAVTAPVREPERAATKPVAAPSSKPTPAAPVATAPNEPAATPTPSAPAGAAGSEYGPVASGETLWEIASRTKPDQKIGVNQMMVALLRANPAAFYKDNVNAIKRGAVLRIPSADEVRSLTPSEAAAAIAAQNSEWGGAREPVKVADSGKTPIAPPTPTTTAAPATTPSHLELVPPKAGAGKSGADKPGTAGGTDTAASAALRADLARTKEQLSAREQEAGELKSRVKDLEKLKADNERLISLKNSQIADLQSKLTELNRQIETQKRELAKAQAAPTAAVTPPPVAPTTTHTTPTTTAPTTTHTTPTTTAPTTTHTTPTTTATATAPTTATATSPTTAVTTSTATSPSTTTSTAPTTTTATSATTTATETTPSTTTTTETADSGAKITPLPEPKPAEPVPMTPPPSEPPPSAPWYTNPLVYGAAGLALILGGVALLFGRRKKAEPELEAEPQVAISSPGDEFHAMPGSPAAVAAHARESDEERALLERLAADPTDTDVQLDLLRLYYLRQDVDKFEQQANAMYAQLPDPSVPAWHRVAEMGRELLPNDPLFTEPPPSSESGFAHEAPTAASGADEQRTEYEFDFDLNRNEPAAAAATAAAIATSRPEPARAPEPEPEPGFDFDLAAPNEPARVEEPSFTSEPIPEFDFDTEIEPPKLETMTTQELRAPTPAAKAPASTPTDSVFGDDDAVGTKLDLARAYLDMGDPDGARSMLQEVLAEGSTVQKDEARKLLTEIG